MAEQAAIEHELKSYALQLVEDAGDLRVTNQESANRVSSIVASVKSAMAKWKAYWKEPKAKAKAAHAILCEREKDLLDRLEPLITRGSAELGRWTLAERERLRKEQEAREKAEWEANQKKREAETKLEDVANFEDAAAIAEEVKPAAPLPPVPSKPDLGGLQARDHWVWEVEDFDAIPRKYLAPDKAMIDDAVARGKGETKIPGIRVINKPIMAQQRR